LESTHQLLKRISLDTKATLEVFIGESLRYCIVHHQDARQLLCPDVSSFLEVLASHAEV